MSRNARRRSTPGTARPLTGSALVEVLLGGWRPLSRLDVDGFAILRSRGVTKRANSVVAVEAPKDTGALIAAIDRVEALCAAAGTPALFRVLPGHGHEEIEDLLAERGYVTEAPSDILELPLTAKVPAPDPRACIETGPLPASWFAAAWRLAPRSEVGAQQTLHDILAGTPAVHVVIPGADPEAPAAVGRAALSEHGRTRAAVLNQVAVDPAQRRRGLGTAVVRTLLAAASVQGADRALLEVETDNAEAPGLFRGLGFRRIGGYHYRVRR